MKSQWIFSGLVMISLTGDLMVSGAVLDAGIHPYWVCSLGGLIKHFPISRDKYFRSVYQNHGSNSSPHWAIFLGHFCLLGFSFFPDPALLNITSNAHLSLQETCFSSPTSEIWKSLIVSDQFCDECSKPGYLNSPLMDRQAT